ncbi:MAG TPA: DotU family type IV/VI secretion system protein, partial [Gemmataceae bacterium]|nr:DotU family type IV/VI secretion system protein [Gemmataceae bacterium]
ANAADLHERLNEGERFELATLLGRFKADLWATEAGSSAEQSQRLGATQRGPSDFLGSRYALTCWLDELFIQHSPCGDEWRQNSLEVAMYGGSAERAHNFWTQARRAQERKATEALEIYYLCVMLGFRGDPSCIPVGGGADVQDTFERLQTWCRSVEARLTLARKAQQPPIPGELPVPSHVPPLTGSTRLGRIAMAGTVTLLVLVLAAAIFLFS